MQMSKRKVALIFGGASVEHDVSLMSARSIYAAIDRDKYDILPVAIARNGTWLSPEASWALLEGTAGAAGSGGRASMDPAVDRVSGPPWAHVGSPYLQQADVAFPVLHGRNGEDGTVQGYLELLGIPYVGSGVLASAVGMDKAVMKQLFALHGLPQVAYTVIRRREVEGRIEAVIERIEGALAYPVFVKPANSGSSLGIFKAPDRAELARALQLSARYDEKLIVEQGLTARELEVAVLDGDPPQVSVAGEIIPRNDFYDYEAKYTDGGAELIVPAPIDEALQDRLRTYALRAFSAIDARGLARVDFFLDRTTGGVYLNEINTIPGFTAQSMYPRLWQASGLPYPALIDRLIEWAVRGAFMG